MRTENWGTNAFCVSMNWGNNAVRNTMALGLLTATPNACIKIFFDEMYKHKKEIESSFGKGLIWQRLDNKKASRIKIETIGDSWDDFYNEDWSERFEWFINTFDKLYPAIFPVWERVQEDLR